MSNEALRPLERPFTRIHLDTIWGPDHRDSTAHRVQVWARYRRIQSVVICNSVVSSTPEAMIVCGCPMHADLLRGSLREQWPHSKLVRG